MEVVPGGHLAPTLTPTEVSEVFGIAESITCCMHFVSDRRKGNTAMCASVGSSLMIIIIQSICMALFMDHKDGSQSKHVNPYEDMVGRCCSREPLDTYAITLFHSILGKTPSTPICGAY